jgi:hypothetical protein
VNPHTWSIFSLIPAASEEERCVSIVFIPILLLIYSTPPRTCRTTIEPLVPEDIQYTGIVLRILEVFRTDSRRTNPTRALYDL